MIHKKNKAKFSRKSKHRKSLLRNLCRSLIIFEQIKTTLPKAKGIRSIIEKIVTIGKKDSLHSKRKLISVLGGSLTEVDKVLKTLSPRYKERQGGYTRVLKAGYRKGDCAPMAVIQFIT